VPDVETSIILGYPKAQQKRGSPLYLRICESLKRKQIRVEIVIKLAANQKVFYERNQKINHQT
jgi:3-polyprenyl-4-hydroxybenzoate decarboxylase